MRRGHGGNWWISVIVGLIGLVIGSVVGRSLPLGVFSWHVGFAPVTLNLYVLTLSVALETNLLGLIGAALGLVLARVR